MKDYNKDIRSDICWRFIQMVRKSTEEEILNGVPKDLVEDYKTELSHMQDNNLIKPYELNDTTYYYIPKEKKELALKLAKIV